MSPPPFERHGGGGSDRMAAFQLKYCRMCALELRQGVLIFGHEGQRLQLPDKIRKTVSILVLEEDSLPKKICTECCSSLEDYSKYKDTVLDAQEKLTSIARNLERSIEASCSFAQESHSSRMNVVIPDVQRQHVKAPVEVSPSPEPLLSPVHSPPIIYSVDDGDIASSPLSVNSVEDTSVDQPPQAVETVDVQETASFSLGKPQEKASAATKFTKTEDLDGSLRNQNGPEVKRCESNKSYQLIIPSPTKNLPSTSSSVPVALVVTKNKAKEEESGFEIKCGLCGVLPQDKKDLEAHHRAEHDLLKYPSPVYGCPECPRITENYNAMRIHLYRHKQDDRFKCKECEKSFAFENQLKGHELAAHNPNGKAFSCKICGKRFSAKCSLVAHMTSKHPVSSEEKTASVEVQDNAEVEFTSSSSENANRDEGIQASGSSVQTECKGTGGNNDSDPEVMSGFVSDVDQSQPSETSQEYKAKTEFATVTGSEAVSSPSASKNIENSTQEINVKENKEENTGNEDGMWKCEYCDKILQSEGGYRSHMKKHRGKRFHCDHCQAVFTQAGSLKHHIITKHPGILSSEEETHECSCCSKVFATKKRLRDHLRLHKQPETALSCTVCKKTYKSAEHLRFHMRYHQSNEHKCSTCGKSFRNSKQLECHENTHTGRKPFKCVKCSTEFGNSGSYYKHIKKCNGAIAGEMATSKTNGAKEPKKNSKIGSSTQIPPQLPESGGVPFGPCNSDQPVSQLATDTATTNIHQSNASHSSTGSVSLPNVPVTSHSVHQPQQSQPTTYLNHGSTGSSEPPHVSQPQLSNSVQATSSGSVTNYSHQQFQSPHHHQSHPGNSISHYQQASWQSSSGNLTQGQLSGSNKSYSASQQSSQSHSGNLSNMDLVDCDIHHTLGSENLSVHNLSYPHHAHVYSPNHHPSSGNQHPTSHGHNISPQSVNSSNPSLPVSNAHSTNAPATSSSLIITSHAPHHLNNNNNPRCHQSEPMELSYKLQMENSEFQEMPMELTKVFQRDPLELCVRQDFNPLMDLSSRVPDGNGMHMNSMNMNNGMNGGGGNGNSSLVGLGMYHNKLDMVDRDLSFSDLSGAFRQPIDLIARPEDSHSLCSEGNLVDLSLRSAAFVQDQSTSTFLRELIDLSARSDSFHGELNLTNKQHHQHQSQSGPSNHNLHNLHHPGTGNHSTNGNTASMNKSSSGGNGQSHHANGANSFQNLYHDSIFSMQN